MIDHVLVIGFGGPPTPEDVRPFLEVVTRGMGIPPARIAEVAHHYERVGGSPYNAHAHRFFEKAAATAQRDGLTQPWFLGMRNWHPFLRETIQHVAGRGLRHGLGLILAPHRSHSSFEKYLEHVEAAKAEVGADALQYDYAPSWDDHPLFIEA